MNPKAVASIVGALVAIVLVLFFPKLAGTGGDSAGAGATTSAPPSSQSTEIAARTENPRASDPATPSSKPAPATPASPVAKPPAPANVRTDIGFGSQRSYEDHFEKHGHEFGSISQAEYLALAQKLRDAPVGGSILEAVRDDGVISRFDKKSGAFIAFNKNKTIRTFFKPNDGVRYFERQIEKEH